MADVRRRQATAGSWNFGAETILAIGAAIICVSLAIVVALNLGRSSFWFDELYSLWVAYRPTVGETMRYGLKDVHPPLYYLSLHGWTALFGEGEVASRAWSLVAASAAILLLYRVLAGYASRTVRLLVCAVAVSSPIWMEQAENVRMYALGFLLGVALVGMMARLVARRSEGRSWSGGLVAGLFAVALAYSLTHFYMFLGALMVMGVLTLAAPDMRSGVRTGLATVLLFAVVGGYTAIVRANTSIDVAHTWFSNDPAALIFQFRKGLNVLVGVFALPGALLMIVAGAWAVLSRRRRAEPGDRRIVLAVMLVLVCAGVVTGGLAVSLLVAPSFSGRNVGTVAPFAWAALCVIVDLCRSRLPRTAYLGLAALLLLGAGGSAIVAARAQMLPHRTEFRAAGRYASAQPACRGATLPVLWRTFGGVPNAIEREQADYQYGYYTKGTFARREIVLVDGDGRVALSEPVRRIMGARILGQDRCPVLAMAAHVHGVDPAAVLRRMAALTPVNSGRRVALVPFSHHDHGVQTAAYLFVVQNGQ